MKDVIEEFEKIATNFAKKHDKDGFRLLAIVANDKTSEFETLHLIEKDSITDLLYNAMLNDATLGTSILLASWLKEGMVEKLPNGQYRKLAEIVYKDQTKTAE